MIVRRRIRAFTERCISLKGDPGSIAAALAVGVFVGVTPTIPFHTVIIVMIGLLFRMNITAAYLGSWLISNPVTIPLLYLSQYELGRTLLGMEASRFGLTEYSLSAIAAMGWRILLPLLTGGIVMAPLIAVPAYFISRRMITAIRAKGCP